MRQVTDSQVISDNLSRNSGNRDDPRVYLRPYQQTDGVHRRVSLVCTRSQSQSLLTAMSLYTFMFSESSSLDHPWFVDAVTGRTVTGTAIKARSDALAAGLSAVLGLGSFESTLKSHQDCGIRDVVAVVSPNSLDFGTVVWASHKLGCTVASINGGSTVDELK